MQSLRTGPAAILGPDGLIYAIGGVDEGSGTSHATDTVERYDETTGVWSYVASMNVSRCYAGAAIDADGKIWAVGGYAPTGLSRKEAERYSHTCDSWESMPDLAVERAGCGVFNTDGGRIYAVGGLADYSQGLFLKSVEMYDPCVGAWQFVGDMNLARSNFGCAKDEQGRVYAIGGMVGQWFETSTVERYDPALDTWEYVASLPVVMAGMSAFLWNGEIYAVGGGAGSDYFHDECYIFNPPTNTWRNGPSMYEEVGATAAVVSASGIAYLLGGEGPNIVAHDRVAMLSPEPLQFVQQPVNTTISAASDTAFYAAAVSDLPVSYQWRKDATPIPGATAPFFRIASAERVDAGSYDCVATAGAWQVVSDPATLTVNWRADFDGDTDVDLGDFGIFAACFNGPNRTPACPW